MKKLKFSNYGFFTLSSYISIYPSCLFVSLLSIHPSINPWIYSPIYLFLYIMDSSGKLWEILPLPGTMHIYTKSCATSQMLHKPSKHIKNSFIVSCNFSIFYTLTPLILKPGEITRKIKMIHFCNIRKLGNRNFNKFHKFLYDIFL